MTKAKMTIFIIGDGLDRETGEPLVAIKGDWKAVEHPVRLATGVMDIASRPMWKKWAATVTVEWDPEQFSAQSVINLFIRAGLQCGIGAGRPFSKESNGMGFGTFKVRT